MAALMPFLSVTPLQPYVTNYNPSRPNLPYGHLNLLTYGGYTDASESLAYQAEHDQIHLRFDSVPESDETIGTYDELRRGCNVQIYLVGHNVSPVHQYLFLFSMTGAGFAQIFLGGDHVRTEELGSPVAVLMDCPGNGVGVNMWVRFAEVPNQFGVLVFRGMDWYLL